MIMVLEEGDLENGLIIILVVVGGVVMLIMWNKDKLNRLVNFDFFKKVVLVLFLWVL